LEQFGGVVYSAKNDKVVGGFREFYAKAKFCKKLSGQLLGGDLFIP